MGTKTFEEIRNEKDQLRKELANTNRVVEQNNQMLKQLMESLNFRHMSNTRDRVHDDDDDEVGDDDDDDEAGGEYYDEELDSESERKKLCILLGLKHDVYMMYFL